MTTDKAQPSSNEAVEAARRIAAADATMETMKDGVKLWDPEAVSPDDIMLCVRYILSLTPGKDVVEGARELVATSEYICGPCGGPLPNPDCGHAKNGVVGCCVPSTDQPLVDRIAAFTNACVAREREACAKIAEASSLHPPYTADGAQASIAAAIRARKP